MFYSITFWTDLDEVCVTVSLLGPLDIFTQTPYTEDHWRHAAFRDS